MDSIVLEPFPKKDEKVKKKTFLPAQALPIPLASVIEFLAFLGCSFVGPLFVVIFSSFIFLGESMSHRGAVTIPRCRFVLSVVAIDYSLASSSIPRISSSHEALSYIPQPALNAHPSRPKGRVKHHCRRGEGGTSSQEGREKQTVIGYNLC